MTGIERRHELAPPRDDVVDAVLRPFHRPSRRFRVAVALLGLVVLAGIVAWAYQLRTGMGVAGYTDRSFWAIYIADVVAFIGVSYGGAVVSAILMLAGASWRAPLVRLAEGVALVTVVVGAAFIVPHLGRPDRLLGMVTHANVSSPVFWDMVAILTYTVATALFFVLPLVPDAATLLRTRPEELGRFRRGLYRVLARGWVGSAQQRRVLHSAMTTVAIVIIPVAVCVHSVLSWAFALVSRPGWHESIWAPYFVVAALYSGVALVIVVVAAFRKGYHLERIITERHLTRLALIMLALGATYVYLTFADLLPSGYVGEQGPQQIVHGMLVGQFAPWFWLFVVVGTLLPVVLVAVPRTRTVPGVVAAAVLVLVGMWVKRVLMVVETAAYDRLTSSFGTAFSFTWVSATTTVAGVAAIALLLMLLFRVVPLLAITEVHELASTSDRSDRSDRHRGEVTEAHAPQRPASWRHLVTRGGSVLLLGLALGAMGAARAPAADAAPHHGPAATPVVTVTTAQSGAENTLTATVTSAGRPVEGALVNFYESTTMFAPGHNLVPLGAVQTDAAGHAAVTYVAAVPGVRTVTAQYYPDALGDPAQGTTQLVVTQARATRIDAPAGLLVGVGRWLLVALFTLVGVVVTVLVAQAARVRRACRPTRGRPVGAAPRS